MNRSLNAADIHGATAMTAALPGLLQPAILDDSLFDAVRVSRDDAALIAGVEALQAAEPGRVTRIDLPADAADRAAFIRDFQRRHGGKMRAAGAMTLVLTLAACGGGGSGGGSGGAFGFAINGPISGATIEYFDGTNWIAVATTDGDGRYDASGIPTTAQMVRSVGGINVDTGMPYTATLMAPAGSTYITPLTTLVQHMIDDGVSAADANAAVVSIMGLSAGTNLGAVNPTTNNTVSEAGKKLAAMAMVAEAAGAGTFDDVMGAFANGAATQNAEISSLITQFGDIHVQNLLTSVAAKIDNAGPTAEVNKVIAFIGTTYVDAIRNANDITQLDEYLNDLNLSEIPTVLFNASGASVVRGGAGAELIIAGEGAQKVTGGGGDDIFQIRLGHATEVTVTLPADVAPAVGSVYTATIGHDIATYTVRHGDSVADVAKGLAKAIDFLTDVKASAEGGVITVDGGSAGTPEVTVRAARAPVEDAVTTGDPADALVFELGDDDIAPNTLIAGAQLTLTGLASGPIAITAQGTLADAVAALIGASNGRLSAVDGQPTKVALTLGDHDGPPSLKVVASTDTPALVKSAIVAESSYDAATVNLDLSQVNIGDVLRISIDGEQRIVVTPDPKDGLAEAINAAFEGDPAATENGSVTITGAAASNAIVQVFAVTADQNPIDEGTYTAPAPAVMEIDAPASLPISAAWMVTVGDVTKTLYGQIDSAVDIVTAINAAFGPNTASLNGGMTKIVITHATDTISVSAVSTSINGHDTAIDGPLILPYLDPSYDVVFTINDVTKVISGSSNLFVLAGAINTAFGGEFAQYFVGNNTVQMTSGVVSLGYRGAELQNPASSTAETIAVATLDPSNLHDAEALSITVGGLTKVIPLLGVTLPTAEQIAALINAAFGSDVAGFGGDAVTITGGMANVAIRTMASSYPATAYDFAEQAPTGVHTIAIDASDVDEGETISIKVDGNNHATVVTASVVVTAQMLAAINPAQAIAEALAEALIDDQTDTTIDTTTISVTDGVITFTSGLGLIAGDITLTVEATATTPVVGQLFTTDLDFSGWTAMDGDVVEVAIGGTIVKLTYQHQGKAEFLSELAHDLGAFSAVAHNGVVTVKTIDPLSETDQPADAPNTPASAIVTRLGDVIHAAEPEIAHDASHSTFDGFDHITDFVVGQDLIDIRTVTGGTFTVDQVSVLDNQGHAFTRDTYLSLAEQMKQILGSNVDADDAALFQIADGSHVRTFLFVNDGKAEVDANDIVVELTNASGLDLTANPSVLLDNLFGDQQVPTS